MKPTVEWFSEDVDGIEYLNVGLKFAIDGELMHAVLGAFQGEIEQDAMQVITALVEQACQFVQEAYDNPKLVVVGG